MIDNKANFVEIAKPLVRRGFRVTPVHPESKMGVMRNWQNWQLTSEAEVIDFIRRCPRYAHHNVGVVGKRGIGRLCILDLDAKGERERIERETGKELPPGYMVWSSPDSKPWKAHHYFLQTEYSFKSFGKFDSKNISVHDLTSVDDRGLHPVLYDVKGIGGGGFVVGAGSVRDNGEVYKCVDNGPVPEIPKWLVDWLIADNRKYKAGCAQERLAKHAAIAAAREKFTPQQRAEMRRQNLPEGFDVKESDIYSFLRKNAGDLAYRGLDPEVIEFALINLTKKFCVGGAAYVETEAGKERIHKVAFDPTLKFGDHEFFYLAKELDNYASDDGLVLPVPGPSRHQVMIKIMKSFPDKISSDDAYTRLENELAVSDFGFDRCENNDRKAVHAARQEAGFEIGEKLGNGRFLWQRISPLPNQRG